MKPDRCPCGAIILADTEEWEVPLCYSCFMDLCKKSKNYQKLRAEALKLRESYKDFVDTNMVEPEDVAIVHEFDLALAEIEKE